MYGGHEAESFRSKSLIVAECGSLAGILGLWGYFMFAVLRQAEMDVLDIMYDSRKLVVLFVLRLVEVCLTYQVQPR